MSNVSLNETDLILLRRLLTAVRSANPYSATNINEAKVFADILSERFPQPEVAIARLEVVA